MILLQIIISRPYQQAAGFKKTLTKNPKAVKKKPTPFQKLCMICDQTVVVPCGGFLIYIYTESKREAV